MILQNKSFHIYSVFFEQKILYCISLETIPLNFFFTKDDGSKEEVVTEAPPESEVEDPKKKFFQMLEMCTSFSQETQALSKII
jgi:hypothetical protein